MNAPRCANFKWCFLENGIARRLFLPILKTKEMKLLLASILVFVAIQLNAQKEHSISEIRKNKHQIELGFRSIRSIYSNTSSATILFKKRYQTGDLIDVNSVKFMRAYFSFNTQINFTDDPTRMNQDSTDIYFHPADIIDITFGIGIEKQFQNKKFIHYIGTDIYGQLFQSDDDFPDNANFGGVVSNSTQTTDRTVRTINTGVNPFFGLKYYITNQFSVGIESGFRMTYFNTKFQEIRRIEKFDPIAGQVITVTKELEPVVSNGIRFNFLGVRFITVGYSF